MTASFNDGRYTCTQIDLYNMAQHAIENSYGDLELVATFTSPGRKMIKMSVIINSSARNTKSPSIDFLNAFVPHASDGNVTVTFDGTWSLQNILPQDLSYFIYDGRDFVTCAEECMWVVYKNSVDIDSSTYARMVGSTVSNRMRKPLQQLSVNPQDHERHVYYSDAVDSNPAYAKKDGKVYMRCRRIARKAGGSKKETFVGGQGGGIEGLANPDGEDDPEPLDIPTQVRSGGLTDSVSKENRAERALKAKNLGERIKNWLTEGGGIYAIILTIILTAALFCILMTEYIKLPITILSYTLSVPDFLHHFLFGRSPSPSPSQVSSASSK